MERKRRLVTVVLGGAALLLVLGVWLLGSNPTTASGLPNEPSNEPGRWELISGGAINDIFFVDGSYGWAAGAGVWRTTDAGATWRRIPVLANATLQRIVFADRQVGWALGYAGTILRTDDGGETWVVVRSGSFGSERILEYQPPGDLWTVGYWSAYGSEFGYWTHSTDGGLSWSEPNWEDFTGSIWGEEAPSSIDFFAREHGWIEGRYPRWLGYSCAHALGKTTDAGQTWTYTCLPVTGPGSDTRFSFGSATTGWLSGDNKLWHSTDGGATWTEQHVFAANITGLQAEDSQRAWVQQSAVLWRTTDGGETWQRLSEAAPAMVRFRTGTEGWGTDGSGIFKTPDGGRTWLQVYVPPPTRPAEWFWDALTGWRISGSTVERTANGGATWQAAPTGLQGIDAFKFVDVHDGWAWHEASLGLAHTTDGGTTWQKQDTGSAALTDLQFVDAAHGWVRDELHTRRTTDGGESWQDIPSAPEPMPGRPDSRSLAFADANRGWTLIHWTTGGGTPGVYHESWLSATADGGNSWGPLVRVPVDAISFADSEHGFGWYARLEDREYAAWEISRTGDGGASWKHVQWSQDRSDGTAGWPGGDLNALDAERIWWGLGYSADGGRNWAGLPAEAPVATNAVRFDRTGRAFVSTPDGLLWFRATEVTAYHAGSPRQPDGKLDEWAETPLYLLNADRAYRVTGTAPTPTDASASIQVAWDPDNLYLALHVFDDSIKVDSGSQPWQDDAIEIGIDGRHDHQRDWLLDDDRQFTVTALGAVYESGNLVSNLAAARVITAKGYILELAIPRARLGDLSLVEGALPGLNWALVDDDDGGSADSKLEWTGTGTYTANRSWGQLRLSALQTRFGPVETEPAPTPTPTMPPMPIPDVPLKEPGDENWSDAFADLQFNGDVRALATGPGGVVYTGGWFTTTGTVDASYIARYDPETAAWSDMGLGTGGCEYDCVNTLVVDESGNLYAGGGFSTAGGIPANRIARWRPSTSSWEPLGNGTDWITGALAIGQDGSLYAAGRFVTAGGVLVNHIARWDPVSDSWSNLGRGLSWITRDFGVQTLAIGAPGSVTAGGPLWLAGWWMGSGVAVWDGGWRPLPLPSGSVAALASDDADNLYAGGSYTEYGPPAGFVAKWNGASWQTIGEGMAGAVSALVWDGNGNLYAGGQFSAMDGMTANRIAKWDGKRWHALGSGMDGNVRALALDRRGNLWVGGSFADAGNQPSSRVARWTATESRTIAGPGTYIFYPDNLPVTIVIPPGGQGDLAAIAVQRFDKDHPDADDSTQTGYYWQIEGLDAAGRQASGYSVDLTLSAPGFIPDGDDQLCRHVADGAWDCAASSETADSVSRTAVTRFSDWAVGKDVPATEWRLYMPRVAR